MICFHVSYLCNLFKQHVRQYDHAAFSCSVFIQHVLSACSYSMDIQQVHVARACTMSLQHDMNIQHGDA
jgi:hypothetical protein